MSKEETTFHLNKRGDILTVDKDKAKYWIGIETDEEYTVVPVEFDQVHDLIRFLQESMDV